MPSDPAAKVPVGFWRHVPWTFVAGFLVSAVFVGVVGSRYDTYGGAVLILWGSVISAGFTESRKLERERRAEGDPRPARRPSTSWFEGLIAAALVLFSGALVVLVSYINFGDQEHTPTPSEGILAGVAVLVSGAAMAGVVLWARRKKRLRDRTAV